MDIVTEANLANFWDDRAFLYRNKTALIFEDKTGRSCRYSYAEMNQKINQAANLFSAYGVQKGDRIAVQLGNSPEFFLAWFGALKIGALMVPINNKFKAPEVAYIVGDCAPVLAVVEAQHLPSYLDVEKFQGKPILVARAETKIDAPNVDHFNSALNHCPPQLLKPVDVIASDDAEIIYTSGTTSRPKGVVLTHYNLLFGGRYTAWQGALRDDDIYLTIMPLWHIDCQCTAAMPAFVSGATFVLLEKYSASKFWRQVCDYRATLTECIPMVIRTLMLQPRKSWERSHQLRDIFYYLSMNEAEKNAFIERFGVTLLSSYGMTETVIGIIGDRPGDNRRWPSIGRPGFGYQIKIMDDDGCESPVGALGEICIKGERGKTLFKEYYLKPEITSRSFSFGGWFRTGDKGYMDEEGYFFFVDRKQDLIKRCGENISSTELENFLVTHPKIIDAAVIGVPDAIYDEQVKAFIVVKEFEVVTEEEILDYCQHHLAKFKVPQQIKIRSSLPRNCSGKVMKQVLKKEDVMT